MSNVNMVGAPVSTNETVNANGVFTMPAQAAAGVLIGVFCGWYAHGGRPTPVELSTAIPAAVALLTIAWRMWVAHHVADKANRIAANPANTAVSLK